MKLIKYFTTVGFVFPRKSLTWTTKFSWLGVWDNQSVTVTEYTLSKKIKNYMAASLCLANSLSVIIQKQKVTNNIVMSDWVSFVNTSD